MPFNVRLRRAILFADRVECDDVFVKLGNPGDGTVIFLTDLGDFVFDPQQIIVVDDNGLAEVTDNSALTHNVRFKRYKRVEAIDIIPE